MTEQWQELKETITELRDNDGTGTQQEVCKFLANLMNVLEKQMSSSENPNKWIPVSERLPKESIPVILTMEIPVFKDKPRREVVLASCHRFCKDKYKWLTYEDEPSIIDFPIAWMPLPESYKLQGSEDKE